MRSFLTPVLAAAMAAALPAFAATGAGTETTTVWKVDTSGHPPFRRTRVEVPVVDTAAAPVESSAEMVTVWTVDRSGKPPYQRRRETVPVVDTAALEAAEPADEPRFRGRPPFRRHR